MSVWRILITYQISSSQSRLKGVLQEKIEQYQSFETILENNYFPVMHSCSIHCTSYEALQMKYSFLICRKAREAEYVIRFSTKICRTNCRRCCTGFFVDLRKTRLSKILGLGTFNKDSGFRICFLAHMIAKRYDKNTL